MPNASPFRAEPWLESPLRTEAGDLELAGLLRNIVGIDPRAMRVLGSYAAVLMVEGKGYYRDARGTACDLGPGDVVLVFPEIAHAYGPVVGGEWTQVYYVFNGPQFDLWRKQGLLRPERPVWRLGAPDYWQQRLASVVKNEPVTGAGAALRALGRFSDVLLEMMAADREAAEAPAREAWLEQSLRLLGNRRAGAGWRSPQETAREVGLSYENFRKRFAALTGESPGQYQKRRRLEWACAAIYQGGHTIKQIADELGFCDVFHFSKAFKQVVGTTPSEYRRRVRGR
ncbi:MAG: AraC family transcriptional regulator [Verrucomicrobiota bacterium]